MERRRKKNRSRRSEHNDGNVMGRVEELIECSWKWQPQQRDNIGMSFHQNSMEALCHCCADLGYALHCTWLRRVIGGGGGAEGWDFRSTRRERASKKQAYQTRKGPATTAQRCNAVGIQMFVFPHSSGWNYKSGSCETFLHQDFIKTWNIAHVAPGNMD